MATSTFYAKVLIDDGLFNVIQVQVLPVGHTGHRFAHKLTQCQLLVIQESAQAIDKVVNNLEAIHHRCRTDLYVAGTECEEVDRIAPIGDAADSGDRQRPGFFVSGNLGNHIQCDRFHCLAAIATMCTHTIGRGVHRERVVVNAHDRVDGIDQRYGICAAILCCLGRWYDGGNIRGQLDDYRDRRCSFSPLSRHLYVFRHLPNCRAHAAFGHAMRTTKIQLKAIDACVFDHRQIFRPGLFIHRQHDRSHYRTIRPVFLDLPNFVQIDL